MGYYIFSWFWYDKVVYCKNIWKYIIMSIEELKKYYLFGVIHNKKPYLLKKWKRKLR